jgi:amino acid transporter
LTDYVLTVAVSISSGVAQIASAYPQIYPFRVELAVMFIFLIMLVNLRGVKESGNLFAIPTYFFLIMMIVTLATGFFRFFSGTLPPVSNPPALEVGVTQPLTLFLLLRAFANGTASVTGVEAISNGITAFKEPRSKNAGITLLWMAGILGSLLISTTFLATRMHALPAESETVISQIARTVFNGRGILYLGTITGTTVILVMAANTAFAGFPRLSALQAADGFLPRQLTYRGSRLVFSRGIVTLALLSAGLVALFSASVSQLIPLYAIGVFLSFTLSQSGMARRWFKSGRLKPGEEVFEPGSVLRHEKGWRVKMIVNAFGAITTFIVMMIFGITKFLDGAWIVVVLIPVLVMVFFFIHRHYKHLAQQLSLENHIPSARVRHNRVVIPIGGVHRGTLEALKFARTISDDVTAVFVSTDARETAKIDEKWAVWGEGFRLVILHSPYRLFLEPLMDYIDRLYDFRQPGDMITIVVPQFVAGRWWDNLLHTRTAETLRKVLLKREQIVIMEVPYQVK